MEKPASGWHGTVQRVRGAAAMEQGRTLAHLSQLPYCRAAEVLGAIDDLAQWLPFNPLDVLGEPCNSERPKCDKVGDRQHVDSFAVELPLGRCP